MNTEELKHLRPTYANIDLSKLSDNANKAMELSSSEIIATVKADAYGHGAVRCAETLHEKNEISTFSVATIAEGMELRKSERLKYIKILVLGYIDPIFYDAVLKYDLTPLIYNDESARSFNNYLSLNYYSEYRVGVKCDTGMSRLGFEYDADMKNFNIKYPKIKVSLVMSHIASPMDIEFASVQEKRFQRFASFFPNAKTSLFASQSILTMENKYDYTRPGIVLYGGKVEGDESFSPVLSLYSVIVHTALIKKGDSVGYDRAYVAEKDMLIGVVPVGYADGYSRRLSNKGRVYINGIACNIVGKVCMDMVMVDVSSLGKNVVGKKVELIGENISAQDIADTIDTIDYEILTSISSRIPRVYS